MYHQWLMAVGLLLVKLLVLLAHMDHIVLQELRLNAQLVLFVPSAPHHLALLQPEQSKMKPAYGGKNPVQLVRFAPRQEEPLDLM